MLEFRMDLMNKIISSRRESSIKTVIYRGLKYKFGRRTDAYLIPRFLQWLESDLYYELRQQKRNKREGNIIEALRIIKEIDEQDLVELQNE